MKANRMWNLAVAAALCTAPMWAQAPGGAPGGGTQSQYPAAGSGQQSGPGSTAAGQDQPGASASLGGPDADKAFVKKALGGSMAEVEMGKLALQKSNNEQVKQFAQKMVDDHGKMIDQMKPAADAMGVKVPTQPPAGEMKKMEKMKSLSGDAFDQAYIKDMVADHKKDDKEFKQEAQYTKNPQLKELVTQSDQTIEEHLHMAEQLAQSSGTQKAKI
ncbi:MAG: putative exported protein [Acidobacteriaceae bacterium]|nr:putative exported protein [Acidobacteriaceae bacterium]